MLKGDNISMAFDDNLVLDNISFTVNPGEIVALVGRNGSGKTTILKILSQILKAKEGQVFLGDEDIETNPSLRANLAYLPDSFNFFPYEKGNKIIEYYKTIYNDFDEDFARAELEKSKLPLDKNTRTLSKGQTTLLGLILILATGADYLLVDEVLDGMDVLNKEKILQYLIAAADSGRAVLVSSHELEELEGISDKTLYLSLDGSLKETSTEDSELLKYQIVVRDQIPSQVSNNAVIKNSIARVHTILVQGSQDQWEKIFEDSKILLYDQLPLQMEDMFYYEDGKDDMND